MAFHEKPDSLPKRLLKIYARKTVIRAPCRFDVAQPGIHFDISTIISLSTFMTPW